MLTLNLVPNLYVNKVIPSAELNVNTIELSLNLPLNLNVNIVILGAELNVNTIELSLNLSLYLNVNIVILGAELNVNTIELSLPNLNDCQQRNHVLPRVVEYNSRFLDSNRCVIVELKRCGLILLTVLTMLTSIKSTIPLTNSPKTLKIFSRASRAGLSYFPKFPES